MPGSGSAMVPARTANSSSSSSQSALDAAYSLMLLSEYTHTLDAIPSDLSRNYADLRELDAVLSSAMSTMITKIRDLTNMIEDGSANKQDRLWLLTEIAEEAGKLKLGGEDKIRVACLAADSLKAHQGHLRSLVEHIPDFDTNLLNRKTTYPHVSARSFMPVHTFESGRRRRGQAGSLLVANNNSTDSPAKRKRVAKDDDLDIGRSPRKEPAASTSRARGNQRKKIERVPSPSESLVSVTSHLPTQQTHPSTSRGAGAKRSRTTSNRNPTPLNQDSANYPIHHEYNVPAATLPGSNHPSLALPYPNSTAAPFDMHVTAQDWTTPLHPTQLEGPGMPVARATSIHSAVSNLPAMNGSTVGTDGALTETGDADGDGDGDGDDKRYCICNGVSYGEMIACDDTSCEKEWFHLSCIGLSVPPDGRWFCDSCIKKNNKRGGRGGKRRGAANRAGAKSA